MRQSHRVDARARGPGLVALVALVALFRLASAPGLARADELPRLMGHTITARNEVGVESRFATGVGSNEFGNGGMLDLHVQLAPTPRFTIHAGLPMGWYGFEYDHDVPDVTDGESLGNLRLGGRMRWKLGARDQALVALGATLLLPTGAAPMEIRDDPRHPRRYAQNWMYWHRPYALFMDSLAAAIEGDVQWTAGRTTTQLGVGVWSARQQEAMETVVQGSVGQQRRVGTRTTFQWEAAAALSPATYQGYMGAVGLGRRVYQVVVVAKGSLAVRTSPSVGGGAAALALDVSLMYAWP